MFIRVNTCLLLSNFQQIVAVRSHWHLLDISRQLACMKLGRREKYQPIQYCWAGCLGYPVHTCHLPIDIQQIYCSAQTGQHEHRRRECCPVWALQHVFAALVLCRLRAATTTCTLHVHLHYSCRAQTGMYEPCKPAWACWKLS